MPELPEVETIRRQLEPQLCGRKITRIIVRNAQLRWPIPEGLLQKLVGKKITQLNRRGKYLLLNTNNNTLIIHFGMSGSLHILPSKNYYKTHDHLIIFLDDNNSLRFNDPRRFGSVLWVEGDPNKHKLLIDMGPEPFSADCTADYLYAKAKNRRVAAKLFLMDGKVISGIGNIYANETLFFANINPNLPVNMISLDKWKLLITCAKQVLTAAIKNCGTTVKSFTTSEGKHGGFQNSLVVYGRDGKPCKKCGTVLQKFILGQRYTVFCPNCQK